MIVVDENLHDQRIMEAISAWYPGQVVSIVSLRPGTVVKDDAIPALLLTVAQPTFVTINVSDFWKRVRPHSGYCIATVDLPKERAAEVTGLLRNLFQLPDFKTKALRAGNVIRLTQGRIEYYRSDRSVRRLSWPD